MNLRTLLARGLAGIGLWLAMTSVVNAQNRQDQPRESAGYSAILDNIDLLVDNYANFLGRKYDLTAEQDQLTRDMLRERTYQFLEKHEGELRSLVDRLFEVRTGADMDTQELVAWGNRVRPLFDEAKKLITDGNSQWREFLTPEQKKIHDEDLKMMTESFSSTEEQLKRITSGEMTIEEFRNPRWTSGRSQASEERRRAAREAAQEAARARAEERRAQAEAARQAAEASGQAPGPTGAPAPEGEEVVVSDGAGGTPEVHASSDEVDPANPRDRKPPAPPRTRHASPSGAAEAAGQEHEISPDAARPDGVRPQRNPADAKAGKPTAPGKDHETEWDRYVEDFIKRYSLNDEQAQQAHTILKDCKDQAERYLASRKRDFEQLDEREESLKKSADKNKTKELSEVNKQRQKLREPLAAIFERQLKPRLDKVPTRAQRRDAEAAAAKPKKTDKP